MTGTGPRAGGSNAEGVSVRCTGVDRPGGPCRLGPGSIRCQAGRGGGSIPCGGVHRLGRKARARALPRADHRQGHAARGVGVGPRGGHNGLRRATAVSSSNWSGYADTNDTFNSVASSWTEPTVNCANSNSGLNGLLLPEQPARRPGRSLGFLGGPRRLQLDERRAAGDGLGLRLGLPDLLRLVRNVPEPLGDAAEPVPGQPGDQMTALVSANAAGTSFTLMIKDATAGWNFSTTQTGSGFARSSAEVIAEAPSSCTVLFCSEVPLADFGQINYSGSSVSNSAGTKGSLASSTPTRSPCRTTGRRWPRRAA